MNNPFQIIRDQQEEIQKLKQQNLRLKMHLQVLVSTPNSKTAEKLRYTYEKEVFSDSIINLD